MRLNSKFIQPTQVQSPKYTPAQHDVGIVHLGIGAFHRAHQAVYTDDALGLHGGDWRILGVSLRSVSVASNLNPQDGLYTLVIRKPGIAEPDLRIIGSIAHVLPNTTHAAEVMMALIASTTRIVSLTVTEKAYGIDRATGKVIEDHRSIAHDLNHPVEPTGAIGLLVCALRKRRALGREPFTVLCCDNLPNNGRFLAAGVIDFARRIDSSLADWIAEAVTFPNTMVDRITPAVEDSLKSEVEAALNVTDFAPVETEPFTQWIIEDDFPNGRPHWESGGAIFVDDVRPFEHMKLRMLNGTHSLLAYAGFLTNCVYVRDVMRNPGLNQLIQAHMLSAAQTLKPINGISYETYAAELTRRFANPELAHNTYQIAMDGTQKIPQRLLAPALHAVENNLPFHTFAFAIAAWMRYCTGAHENGALYELQDPRQIELSETIAALRKPAATEIYRALVSLPDILPVKLSMHKGWEVLVIRYLHMMMEQGMQHAIDCAVSESI